MSTTAVHINLRSSGDRDTIGNEYLLQVIRYVHTNPVSAKLVKRASDWEFSDCSVWVSDSDAEFPGKSFRDEWFRDGKGYRAFLEAYEPGTFSRDIGSILDP